MKRFAVLVAGILMLAQTPLGLVAQEASGLSVAQATIRQSEWAAIEAVPEGTDMALETKAGETIKGKFISVTGSTLKLSRKNRTSAIELPDVKKAYRLVGRSRKKSTAIGAGAGGAAGLGLGLGVYLPNRRDFVGAIVPVFAVIGTGIGAAIGALTGGGRKKILIYEAR